MRLVYIAGRYSGASRAEVERNLQAAREAALALTSRRICNHQELDMEGGPAYPSEQG